MGFSLPPVSFVKTSEEEESLDKAYLKGLSERCDKIENLVDSIELTMSRIRKLMEYPQAIELEKDFSVYRDKLLELEGNRMHSFVNQLSNRIKDGLI